MPICEDNSAARGICEWADKHDRHLLDSHDQRPRPDCWYCAHPDGGDDGG